MARENTDTTTLNRAAQTAVAPVVLDDVTKRYGRGRGSVTALDGVSLSFAAGSFTAVLGVSGSGKSTLLQCAAGLERSSSGAVRLCGKELSRLSQRKQAALRRQRVGFVFQELNLLPELTVAENIALPLRLDHRPARRADIEQAASRVGLSGAQLSRRPAELSGGQQQRVAIARALITRPDVIFADEPTGALDPHTAAGVLRLLREAADGTTVVIVTHDPQVTRFCDQAVFLYAGRVDRVLPDPEPAVVARLVAGAGRARRPGAWLMGGWMLAGIRRGPGPLIGTVVASAAAAVLTVAAISIAAADTQAPAGRLASASVVVAGSTNVTVTLGSGDDANHESLPLPAYRGVPASLAQRLAQVPGAASAAGESGFPDGTVRPGDVDLVAVTAKPGVSPDVLASRIRAALRRRPGLHDRDRRRPRRRGEPERRRRAVQRPVVWPGRSSSRSC